MLEINYKKRKELRAKGMWVPNPGPQELAISQAYNDGVYEIFFGGSRGPGKTAAGQAWMLKDIMHPQLRALVIRKNADDLSDWVDRSRTMYAPFQVSIAYRPPILSFPHGAMLRTGHLNDDAAYTKYQGHEYHRMLIEELTQIPNKKRYLQLIASCRSTVPELKPQIFITANPGGIGHAWVRDRFIDPDPSTHDIELRSLDYEDMEGNIKKFHYKYITEIETGLKRVYIPATIDDNPILKEADPNYVKQLDSLQSSDHDLWRAWRHGDWDIFVGQVFKEWAQQKGGEPWHVIPGLGITREEFDSAVKYVGFDWGYNDPASAHWILLLPENDKGVRRFMVYKEMYQNELNPQEWGEKLAEAFKQSPVRYLVLPHDAYSHLGGNKTIVSVFEEVFQRELGDARPGILRANSLNAGARMNRQHIMHQLLAEAPDGKPYVQILHTCHNLIKTLPNLPYDEKKPEEIDPRAEDHAYDSLTYGLMTMMDNEGMIISSRDIKRSSKQSFIVDGEGNALGFSLDTGKMAEQSSEASKDWRHL